MQSPPSIGKFRFVILASLRAVQLTRGCRPRIEGDHKHTVMAQLEVSQGKVYQATALTDLDPGAAAIAAPDAPDEQPVPVLVAS